EALNDIDSTNFENVLDRLDAIDSAEEDYINMQDTQNLIERLKIKIAEQKEKSYWIPSWGI
ncbi:hypothetical protein K9K77_03205, partial [Candidatus Babeliales bacterium]|nr:hypothetical protein [Candidatus Babeliales bacterium]